MDVFEAIERRHSYRGPFRDQPVPQADLRRIVQAGLLAPSGGNAQTTRFVIVDDPDLISDIRALHPTNTAMQQAPAYVACVLDREPAKTYGQDSYQVEDCAAAVENMLLAVTGMGYATVWVDGWLRRDGLAERIGQLIGLPDTKIVRIILPIGLPAESHQQAEKMAFDERVWFNQYGG